jgi:hypothetical protein
MPKEQNKTTKSSNNLHKPLHSCNVDTKSLIIVLLIPKSTRASSLKNLERETADIKPPLCIRHPYKHTDKTHQF